MDKRAGGEKMAVDDIFFSIVLIVMGLYASRENWIELDWSGLFGTILISAFGGLWLAARIYHLTHRDEVFGRHDSTTNGSAVVLVCPECGADTYTDTHTPCGDHPELTVVFDACGDCDWVSDERPATDGDHNV